jgi:sporulation protein YlmC with PRC-barrel domain
MVGLYAQSQDASQNTSLERQAADERKLFLYSGSILDKVVTNPEGDKLGRITQLVLDANTGQVAYITLAVSMGPGLSQKTVLVPWKAVEVTPDGKRIMLRASQQSLKHTPSIEAGDNAQRTN